MFRKDIKMVVRGLAVEESDHRTQGLTEVEATKSMRRTPDYAEEKGSEG